MKAKTVAVATSIESSDNEDMHPEELQELEQAKYVLILRNMFYYLILPQEAINA